MSLHLNASEICSQDVQKTTVAYCALRTTDADLKLPLLKTRAGQKSFLYPGARLWNSLNREAKMATSLSAFKWLSKSDVDTLSQS